MSVIPSIWTLFVFIPHISPPTMITWPVRPLQIPFRTMHWNCRLCRQMFLHLQIPRQQCRTGTIIFCNLKTLVHPHVVTRLKRGHVWWYKEKGCLQDRPHRPMFKLVRLEELVRSLMLLGTYQKTTVVETFMAMLLKEETVK